MLSQLLPQQQYRPSLFKPVALYSCFILFHFNMTYTDPSLGTSSAQTCGPSPYSKVPKTEIKVIVVGAGFGGLCAAIECHRQGHKVEIYEKFEELKVLGDIISFGANAGRIFRRWKTGDGGRLSDRLSPLSIKLQDHGFNIHKWTGELVMNQKTPPANPDAPVFNGHRGEFHRVVFDYVKDELGIPIHLGQRIEEYVSTVLV